jgi:predicted ATPase
MFFIGTYRDNEVSPDHIVFGFLDMLSQFNVTTSRIHLNGLAETEVNSMISDALATLPRVCRSLSHLVFRKTNGNPYYVLEFLRSLIHRDLVQFSLRERRWIWDHAKVYEETITDNVLHLLSNKLSSISECMQTALKCASCLGIQIDKVIAKQLSGYWRFVNLHAALDNAVEDGFMDCDGTHYRFVHDKLREAAYDLIEADAKDQFHFELGMAMHSCCAIKENMDALFATINQINHGFPCLLIGTSHQHNVAELNYEASVKSTQCADFTLAFDYAKAAVSLLANDSWNTQYSVSIKYYLQLGKSAFSCGFIREAKAALDKIVDGGKCLDDKIDAYFLLVATPSLESVRTCVNVLRYVDMLCLCALSQQPILTLDELMRFLFFPDSWAKNYRTRIWNRVRSA